MIWRVVPFITIMIRYFKKVLLILFFMKSSLSVIVITKNEEANIKECLESVSQIAEEIIIVDSKSTDNTVAIARKFTRKISTGTFRDYKEKREEGLKKATNNWVLFLDADERVSQILSKEIRENIEKGNADGYYIPFKNFFLGKWLRYGGWYPDYHLRLGKREKVFIENPVHETICVKGLVGYMKHAINHYSDKSLYHRVNKTNIYTSLQAEQRAGQKNTYLYCLFLQLCILPPLRFVKMYFMKRSFLDGIIGFIRAYLYMYTWFLVYMKEMEINLNKKEKRVIDRNV